MSIPRARRSFPISCQGRPPNKGKKGGNQGADSAGASAIHCQPFAARAGRAAARRPRRRRGSQTCTPRDWRSARRRGGAVIPGMATGGLCSRMRSGFLDVVAVGSTTSRKGGGLGLLLRRPSRASLRGSIRRMCTRGNRVLSNSLGFAYGGRTVGTGAGAAFGAWRGLFL